jgi:hypothetical protein
MGGSDLMDNESLAIKLQEVIDRSLRNEGRIKKLEAETDTLHKLATSAELMALQLKTLNSNFATLSKDVESLKEKPSKRWDSLVDKTIWLVAGALITYLLSQIGL